MLEQPRSYSGILEQPAGSGGQPHDAARPDPVLPVTVVVPTFKRPDYLRRAVASLLRQTQLPSEIVLVSRVTDEATNLAIAELMRQSPGSSAIRHVTVDRPGFLPPIEAGIAAARGDIVAFLDDDGEAHRNWLARMSSHYADPTIGGVGGRCVNFENGKKVTYPPAAKVGTISWFGRATGNMYRDTTFSEPVETMFLMGGCMSYRRQVLKEVRIDRRLGENVSFHWEIDVGLQVSSLGMRIVFDPNIAIDHHSAPRDIAGMRTINADAIYWSNFNYALIIRKHMTRPRLLAYLAYSFMVGWSGSPGVLNLIYRLGRGSPVDWLNEVVPSIRGRLRALRA